MKKLLKFIGILILLLGFFTTTANAEWWTQNTPNSLVTNTGNGPANADIHVAHCYIGIGTGTPCGGGASGITGAGTSNQVSYFTGTHTIASDSSLTYVASSGVLNVGTQYNLGGNFFATQDNTNFSLFIGNGSNTISGGKSENTIIGRNSGGNLLNGFNTFVGANVGVGMKGAYNTVIGSSSGGVLSGFGSFNTIVGRLSGGGLTSGNGNTLMGVSSGATVSSNNYNTFVGYFSGLNQTSGDYNTSLGYGSNSNNNAGTENTYIGASAGYSAVGASGSYNSILGVSSGDALTTASHVAFFGRWAGNKVTTGSNDTLIGDQAGYNTTTGANNTYIGNQAAISATTGSNNIALGYNIDLPSNTSSNQLDIGNIIYGTSIDGSGTTVSTGKIGIGTQTPSFTLDTGGTNSVSSATFTGSGLNDLTSGGTYTGNYTYNYRVTIDATGTPDTFKWTDVSTGFVVKSGVAITGGTQTLSNGVTVIFTATTGHTLNDRWDFAGNATGNINAKSGILIGGNQALSITSTRNNISLGINNGSTGTGVGTKNTYIGNNIGRSNTGTGVTIIGNGAGSSITTGTANTFLGNSAGNQVTTGIYNTILGDDETSGNPITTGSYNVFIGANDGLGGAQSDVSSSIRIGVGAATTASNQLSIGGNDTNGFINDGYIGRGVTSTTANNFTLQTTGGSGSNKAGNTFTLSGSKGTGTGTPGSIIFSTSTKLGSGSTLQSISERARIDGLTGFMGINTGSSVSAELTIGAGTATAGTAPLKLVAGTVLGTTEAGAIENDGTHLYYTAANAGTRFQLDQQTPTTLSKVTTYNGTTTTGNGLVSIVGSDRQTGLIAAQNLATLTVPGSDTSYDISSNVNMTAVAVASFQVTCTYTDETNTSRTLVLNFSQINGTLVQTLTAALGAGAYEGVPLHIRAKAGTTVIIGSTGTFTSVTYNLEESIHQITG